MSFLLALALACAPGTGDADTATVDVPIVPLPGCELHAPGDVDIEAGCALGVCAESTYAAFRTVLGEADDCAPSFSDKIRCEWDAGVYAYFEDADGDELVEDTSSNSFLYLEDPGLTTPEGLGLGVSLQCFFDELGLADDIDLTIDELVGDVYFVEGLTYSSLGLYLHADADGRCDSFGMTGPD